MPVDVKDIKKSAVASAWGNDKPVTKKDDTKDGMSTTQSAVASAWGEKPKKKDGTEDVGTGSPKIVPIPLDPQSTESKAIQPQNKTVDKSQVRIPNVNKSFLTLPPNREEITTPDGGTLQVDNSKGAFIDPAYSKGLQERINNKTFTGADINNIAYSTGKSQAVVRAYLTQGKQTGFAVDNFEKEQKNNEDLVNSIKQYNYKNGTQYNPSEVLSSPDKSAEFLRQLKSEPFQHIKKEQQQRQQGIIPTDNINLDDIKKFDDYVKALSQHVVTQTVVEDKKNGVPKDQTIINIAKRNNPQGLKEFKEANSRDKNTVVNPAGEAYDAIFGAKSKDELMNTVKGEAELQYNDAASKLAINKISQGILAKDQNKINEGQAELKLIDENTIFNYPSLVKQEIARRVSETIARDEGQLVGSETHNVTGKVLGASELDYFRAMKDLGYLDNPKTKDLALSMLSSPDQYFADASYIGGMGHSFLQPFKELGMSIGDITGFRNAKDILSDKKKDELFPKELANTKADFSLPLVGDVRVRNVLNTTANLAGMTAIAATTEGLGTEIGLGTKGAKALGAYTSFGLPSYDGALKDSYNFLDTDASRSLYATITAITNAEGGRFLDLGKAVRIPGLSEVYSKMAKGLTEESLSKEGVSKLLGEGKNKYVDFAVKYGKNVTKGAATMAYFNISNNIERLVFGDPTISANDVLPQAAHAFIDGVTGMSIMGAFGAVADMRNEKNTSYKGFIYNMALNHDVTEDVFKQGLKDGTYTQDELNQKMKILNEAKVAKSAMDLAQQENNVLLNENQKSVYVANKTAISTLKSKLENTDKEQEGKRNELKLQIERLDQQNKDVMAGLKFTPTLEPLYDLFEAEKEYNKALDEVNNGEGGYDKVEKAKNNYDNLINQYYAHEKIKKPQAKSTEGKDNQTTDTENEKTKDEGVLDDTKIKPTFDKTKILLSDEQIGVAQPIIDKVHNAEYINEKELNSAQDVLYDALDKHRESAHLIEPLILKLQDYDFATKTETRTVTEKVPVEGAAKTDRPKINSPIEHIAGNEATITDGDGNKVSGTLSVKYGNYVVTDKDGKEIILGEKQITDRDAKHSTDIPITFNKDGGIESITFDVGKTDLEKGGTKKDKSVTVNFDPTDEKSQDEALDLAVQFKADEVGTVPDKAFDQAFTDVQKEIQVEVPVKDISSQKPNKDEKESSENRQEGGKESSQESDGKKGDGKDNVEDTTNPSKKQGTAPEGGTVPSITHEVKYNDKTKQFDVVSDKGTVMGSFDTHAVAKEQSDFLDAAMKEEAGKKVAEETGTPPPPGVSTSDSPNTEDRLVTGIRNSVIDAERVHSGVEPFLKTIKSRWADLWNTVSKNVQSGVLNTTQFVNEQAAILDANEASGNKNKKLLLSDYENAVMLYNRVKLLNDLKNTEDALKVNTERLKFDPNEENTYANEKLKQDLRNINDQLRVGERVLRATGKATAQALSSRQMMADMFGKLVSWEDYINQQYDGNPPPEMVAKARRLQEQHAAQQQELNAYYEEQISKAADEAYKKGVEDAKKQGLGKKTNKTEKNKNLADKLRKAADSFEKFSKIDLGEGGQIKGISLDVQKMVANAMRHIADGIENNKGIGKLINEAIELFSAGHDKEEFRNYIKDNLGKAGIKSEQDKFLSNIKDDTIANKSTSIVTESVSDIKKLMNQLIKDGDVRSLSELTAKTKELLKDSYPDATEREIRDLYSGYGISSEPRDEIQARLAQTKLQAKIASELEDLLKPFPNETKLEEKKRFDKINRLLPVVEQYMKEQGIEIQVAPFNDAQRVKLALDGSTNRIKGISDTLGKKVASESKELREANEPVEDNPRIKELNTEKEFLDKRVNEINNSTSLSNAQKVQRIDDLLRNQKGKLERKLREGSSPLLPADKRLSAAEQNDLKERIREYNKQISGLKEDLTPDAEKNTGALNTYKDKLSQRIAELEKRIKDKNFEEEKTTAKKDFTKDKKAVELELQLHKTQNEYYKLKRTADDHGKSTYKKSLDTFNNYVRFNVLSNYMTLAKLGMAVAENMVFTPIEQAIGMGYTLASKVPFFGQPLKSLLDKADRHGAIGIGTYASTEWQALKSTFTKGAKDAWQELKQNNSELGILYGDESSVRGMPDEYKDVWYKINNALGSAARLHGAEKAFFKRNEFTRSYLLRKGAAERKGRNVNDPVLQHEMAVAAYSDAMTSILLGDNKLYDFYRTQVINRLQNSDNIYSNGLGSFLQFMTPIVKVPSNLVLMGGRATFGWLAGGEIGVRAMVELVKPGSKFGIESLNAKESDALLRNLKKGSLGLGLITLGFLRPDMFGAATYYKKGVQGDNDLEDDEVTFFGVKLPRWATDNPFFWAMKMGASARHFYDYYKEDKGKSTASAITNTALDCLMGGAGDIPMLGTWTDASSAMRNPDGKFASNFLYNQLAKTAPASGFTRQLAKDTDKDEEGKPIKRHPQTIGEAYMVLYPGLREKVEE